MHWQLILPSLALQALLDETKIDAAAAEIAVTTASSNVGKFNDNSTVIDESKTENAVGTACDDTAYDTVGTSDDATWTTTQQRHFYDALAETMQFPRQQYVVLRQLIDWTGGFVCSVAG